jgi:S1-C subfamily serine protease
VISAETLAAVKQSTCAIGYLREYPDSPGGIGIPGYSTGPGVLTAEDPTRLKFEIVGTGFVIRNGTALTARHVIEKLAALRERGIPDLHFRALFHHAIKNMVVQHLCRALRHGWLADRSVDLGLVDFHPTEGEFRAACAPIPIADVLSVHLGQQIAVLGYPFGSDALEDDDDLGRRRVYRIGPVLQQGHLSGISRWHGRTYRLLLDVRTARIMSGAPVVNPVTGVAVGVHTSGMELVTAFAIPIDGLTVTNMLAGWDLLPTMTLGTR